MNLIKKFWEKIKQPKGIYLALFYICFVCVVALTIVLVIIQPQQTVVHYILYALSALGLTYFVYSIVVLAPKMKSGVIKLLKKNKFTNSLLSSYGYRTIMFSVFSFILNISYVAFQGVLAIITGSAWYISITVYYLVLSMMKGTVFHAKRKSNNEILQTKTYRFCGIMFLILTVALSGIILLIYTSNMYFEYAGLLIYAIASYTFYKLSLAIYNIFKARKQDDLYIQSIRNINLTSALVSIIVLQVAMFQAFSPENNTSIANALTGGFVAALILALAIFMIIKANKILKQQEVTNEKQ